MLAKFFRAPNNLITLYHIYLVTMPSSGLLKRGSTKEVDVPKLLLDQIVGQERSVELIRKAAIQRRNVLLVGLPGTGKSMLAKAMSEIMPVQKLQDVLIYPNDEDQNNPLVKTTKAGDGSRILEQSRFEARAQEDNLRLIGFIVPLAWFLLSYVVWTLKLIPDVVYAATLILGGFLMVGFALGAQMKMRGGVVTPRLLVNNAGKKIAPFFEATGARAGALLGDVRHDPLQSLCPVNTLTIISGGVEKKIAFEELWNKISKKYPELVEKHGKGYEAIVIPRTEEVYTYGADKEGKVVRTRIYSMNRRPYDNEVVEVSAGNSKLTMTPEHKVVAQRESKEIGKLTIKDRIIKLAKSYVLATAQR